jgi:hypothetical protein
MWMPYPLPSPMVQGVFCLPSRPMRPFRKGCFIIPHTFSERGDMSFNKVTALDAAKALLFRTGHHWRGASEFLR